MGNATSIEHRKPQTALSPAHAQRSHRSGLIVAHLAKLALMMGEPMDKEGARLRLMADDLADLPVDSVQHAIMAWRRGDTFHLSAYEQEHTRIGVFFPKPAELREIAEFYLRQQHQKDRDRKRIEQDERDERHRRENPDEYVPMADIVREHYLKRGMREAATLPAASTDEQYSDPRDRVMAALSRGMYAGKEYEASIVAQVHEWRTQHERKAEGS